jgi:hypothetical protein
VYVGGGSPQFDNCHVTGNTMVTGDSAGGGVYVGTPQTVSFVGGSVSLNVAASRGGGVCLDNGTLTASNWQVTGNAVTSASGNGGGVCAYGGSAQLTGCSISSNTTGGSGGGIASNVSMSLTDCTVDFNDSASGVGAWYKWGATCWMQGTRVRNNTGSTVGGVANLAGNLAITSSEFCSNGTNISGAWTDGGGNQFAATCSPYCAGDADGDGFVDAEDIAQLLAAWGFCGGAICPADFNGDGIVNGADLTFALANWGPCSDV